MALLLPLTVLLLWWPQTGDQALFQLGGRVLADGGVYWRDFWDLKQPGVFWLYALSEWAGTGVLGARLLEMVMAMAAGAVTLSIVRQWRLSPAATLLAPLLVVGPYLLAAAANGVGQVEGLFTLPMLLAYQAGRRLPRAASTPAAVGWGAVVGLVTSAVVVTKLVYLPVVAVAVLAAVAGAGRDPGGRRQFAAGGIAAGCAFVVPLGVLAGFAVRRGIVNLAWWSTFDAPREELATGLFTSAEAVRAVLQLGVAASVTGPLAVVALVVAVRRRRAATEAGLVAWCLVLVLLATPQLPTTYRSLALLPPLGLLAVLGLDHLLATRQARRPVVRTGLVVVALVVTLPLLLPTARLARLLVSSGPSAWSLSDPARLAVGDALGGSSMVAPAGVMRERIRPGTAIYVLGDPVVYRVLGARQGVEMNGWGPEVMSPRMWREIVRELDRSRPEWVFVQSEYRRDVDAAPEVGTLLRRWYRIVDVPGAGGTWWRTDRPGIAPPTPDGNQVAATA